jgi:hypothetical protein
MAEAYLHNMKKAYQSILEINKEKDNEIKLLKKEVKTLQGQLQEQYKVRQERYNENKKEDNHYPDES